VIGRSNVSADRFATLLTQRNATVTVCHRKTVGPGSEVRVPT
jgi:5,10-methylene-tetrahydrofolate dehydrogenase/methenyl tetrahydrofolate cyclohydrolase